MHTLKFLLGFVALALFAQGPSPLANPVGVWQTIDDKTGQVRGTVKLYAEGDEVFGRIASSVNPKDATDVCDLCPGDRKNKPILGLVILRRMKQTGSEWGGGDILDPDTGFLYRCKFRMMENGAKMTLRGYLGVSLLGRSQIWIRQR